MKYNGKLVVYRYENIKKLLNDLMDSTCDRDIYERGLIRDLSFRIPMEKEDIERFHEDLTKEKNLFMSDDAKDEGFIGPCGIHCKIELIEVEK